MQTLPPKLLSLAILPFLIEATVAYAQPTLEDESTDESTARPRYHVYRDIAHLAWG